VLRNKAQFYRVPARYVFSSNAPDYANVYNCEQLCLQLNVALMPIVLVP